MQIHVHKLCAQKLQLHALFRNNECSAIHCSATLTWSSSGKNSLATWGGDARRVWSRVVIATPWRSESAGNRKQEYG